MLRRRVVRAASLGLVLAGIAAYAAADAAWRPIGPPGTRVRSFFVDPESKSLFLGTRTGKIFVSADAGGYWENVYIGPPGTGISGFASSGTSLYAALTIDNCGSGPGTGVIRSADGGRTWARSGLEGRDVKSLQPDPGDAATIYAVAPSGLYRTSDGGAAWATIYQATDNQVLSFGVDPTNSDVLFLETTLGATRSVDRGKTFLPMRHPVRATGPFQYGPTDLPKGKGGDFVFDPASPGTVYATSGFDLYRSTDLGEKWYLYGSNLSVVVDPSRPGTLYGIGKSGDVFTGVSPGVWTRVSQIPLPETNPWAYPRLAADPKVPGRLYAANDWLPYRSDDGGQTWIPIAANLRDLPLKVYALDPSDPLTAYASVYYRGILKTSDGGLSWGITSYSSPQATIDVLQVDPFDSRRILGFESDSQLNGPRVLRSADGGASWSWGPKVPRYDPMTPYWSRVLLPDPTTPGIWYFSHHDEIHASRDGGETWGTVVLRAESGFPFVINALAADTSQPGVVYAAGYGGLYRTANWGGVWELAEPGFNNTWSLAVDPRDSSVYATLPEGLLRKPDKLLFDPSLHGGDWTRGVSLDSPSNVLYLSTSNNVFRSFDSGATWQAFGEGLVDGTLSQVFVHPMGGPLRLMTSDGLYEREPCGDAATLCLGLGRFLVAARWKTPDGQTGPGRAVSLSVDSGYFWFFSPNSVEIVAKIVDGCAVNSRAWVFGSGLTNVEVEMTVTDRRTGAFRRYLNTLGSPFQPIQDTNAFAVCPVSSLVAGLRASERRAEPAALVAGSGCVAGPTTLCLAAGRFQVRASWRAPDGASGLGQAVKLTSDTGYFWFFNPASAEVLAKVVDGCAVNSRHWTFAGGMTNLEVVLTITDTETGEVRAYVNPQGSPFGPIQDAAAFAACP